MVNESLPGPDDIYRHELANGIVVLCRTHSHSPSVVINGFIGTGALYEPEDKTGLADFTASALMHGTVSRSFQQIYDLLESAGASLHISGGTHTTGFGGQALAEDFELLLNLLADSIRQPIFPEEQIERLRAQLLASLAIRAQDTMLMAQMAFDQLVYAGHPYSRPQDGYPETIQAITRQDLESFHRRNYGPKHMVISVVGAVQLRDVIEQIERTLGDWRLSEQPEPPPLPELQPLVEIKKRMIAIPGKSQSDLVIGVAGPPRRSADYTAASLGNNILGQFGLMGRLGEVIREKAGLAYYIQSSLGGGLGPGAWDISAGVDPRNVEKTIDLARNEIHRFITEPVSAEELADTQANFIGSLPLSLESNYGVAAALTRLERYQLGLDYYRNYPEKIRSVSSKRILEVAQRYLHPDRLGIGIAGP